MLLFFERRLLKQKILAILGRLALVASGVLFALIMLEIGFRILYPDPSPKLVNQGLRFDNTLGLAFTPGVEGWNTSLRGEYSTYVTINNKGLRGREYAYTGRDNTFRILMLGDSFTAGLQVPETQTFSKLLEARLRQQFPKTNIEVINAGVVGYGTDNELASFTREGYKYRPNLVLLAFFTGNDLTDNIWRALYTVENGQLVFTPPQQRRESIAQTGSAQATALKKARTFLYTHSRLYSVSIELLTLSAVKQIPALVDWLTAIGLVEITRPMVNYGNFYAFRYLPQEAWLTTEALLVELNKEVEAHNSQLVVAILPDEADVDPQRRQEIIESYANLTKEEALSGPMPSTRLAQTSQRKNILHVELLPALQTYLRQNNQPLYYKYDGHWTPAGHTVAGQAIFDYLMANRDKLNNFPAAEK